MTVGRIPSVEGGIQPTIFDAKADLLTATANDTPARLAVGANDLVVTADSSTATGLAYTGGWTTWSPTYLNITVGNGTVTSRYRKLGKRVDVYFKLVWGSTTSCGSYPNVSYPISPSYTNFIAGNAYLLDTGTAEYAGLVFMDGANGMLFQSQATNGNFATTGIVQAASPVTWTTNDVWAFSASYEVA